MSEFAVEGGDPVEEQVAAPEGEATEVEAPEAATPESPTLDPLELQAELEHSRAQYGEVLGILEQLAAQNNQPVQQTAAQAGYDISELTDEYGNLDPQKFAAFQNQRDAAIVSRMEAMFQPIQQQFQSAQEAQVIAEGEQRLQDIIADDVAKNGEFVADPEKNAEALELVNTLASAMFPDVAARYGNTPQAAEMTMLRAAAQVRGLLRSAGGAAVSQTQDHLSTLASARGEPGAGGAGVEAPVVRLGESSAAKFGINQ